LLTPKRGYHTVIIGRRSNLLQRGCIILGSYHVISTTATACVEQTALKSPERGIVKGCARAQPGDLLLFGSFGQLSVTEPGSGPHQRNQPVPAWTSPTPLGSSRQLVDYRHPAFRFPVPSWWGPSCPSPSVTVRFVACSDTLFRQPFSGDRRRGRCAQGDRPLLSPLIVRARGHRCG